MRHLAAVLSGILCLAGPVMVSAELSRWRVGDRDQPWNLVPVTGRLTWGRGWACEVLVDDDADGLVDEDPVELVDNDDDGLVNEDPPDVQVDNDGDGRLNEDPVNNRDDDGDGRVDEDPVEAFDQDLDGLVDEDGPDLQLDNDADGRLSEDPRYTDGDDDFDGRTDEDPADGLDNDGDGLVDEDGPQRRGDDGRAGASWLQPIFLDSLRNLATELNQRYLHGEFGGVVPGADLANPFMIVPSEYGPRTDGADPVSGDHFMPGGGASVARTEYQFAVDNDLNTAMGGAAMYNNGSLSNLVPGNPYYNMHRGGISLNLMGYYCINRIVFRPRPSLPAFTMSSYYIAYGDQTTISTDREQIIPTKLLVPLRQDQSRQVIKDLRFDPPVRMGRLDVVSMDAEGTQVETAEARVTGVGFPLDASYTSEVIDLGGARPRPRRYDRLLELFPTSATAAIEAQFPSLPGRSVNFGKVRWRGRRIGNGGDVRVQFRAGNTPDTHVYARRIGPNETDYRDEDGNPLTYLSWVLLKEGRIPERELVYNELGVDLGADGRQGWTYWTAPLYFEDGLIDTAQPAADWTRAGVPLQLPGGLRYVQFRLLFDSTVAGAVSLDYLEFDYSAPLVGNGVAAEVFPYRVPLGQETVFHYYLRPDFAAADTTRFNRLEIDVPDSRSGVDSVRYDGRAWAAVALGSGPDALTAAEPRRLAPAPGSTVGGGEYAWQVVPGSSGGPATLQLKLPPLGVADFRARQTLEVVLRSRLSSGAARFEARLWNDRAGSRGEVIAQPVQDGDVVPYVSTNAVLVTADGISGGRGRVQVQPNPFSPNGDGVNDATRLTFDLYLVLEPVATELTICDLAGRAVRRLPSERSAAGQVVLTWDGRDDQGRLVPPGNYLYDLRVQSDHPIDRQVGLIAVAY